VFNYEESVVEILVLKERRIKE